MKPPVTKESWGEFLGKPECSNCYDTGVSSKPNGPDDVDWDPCNSCDLEVKNFELAKEQYIAKCKDL